MFKIDYKQIINPIILLTILGLFVYFLGFRGFELLMYTFIVFFFVSFLNNLILILTEIINWTHYLFVYIELFFSLLFLIPLFYLVDVGNPLIISFFVIGLTDFTIQFYYNILPRKDGKELIRCWKDNLIKSERRWFHPISMQRYTFKDFICEIIEPNGMNPTSNHVLHHDFMIRKTKEKILKRKFGNRNIICFDLEDIPVSKNEKCPTGIRIDRNLYLRLKKIDKKIVKGIITCYKSSYKHNDSILRIVFDNDFVLENPNKVYNFLKKVKNDLT